MNLRYLSVLVLLLLLQACWPHGAAQDPTGPASISTVGPLTPSTPEPATRLEPSQSGSTAADPTSETTTAISFTSYATSATTYMPVVPTEVCLCDLRPGFCDIGCCCDVEDCGVSDLKTVFSDCPETAVSGVCVEKWLMFRANVDPALITDTSSQFCVRPEGNTSGQLISSSPLVSPILGDSYHFSPPVLVDQPHSRPFYRVDDVILTYFSKSSLRGFLRQPSPGTTTVSCVDMNPARFLRSASFSCSRVITPGRCSSEAALNAQSYWTGLSLLKVPSVKTEADLLIPVTPLSEWPAPRRDNDTCLNVVSKVELALVFTGAGALTYATVKVELAAVATGSVLSQTHSLTFQLTSPRPSPAGPMAAVGLRVGSPVIGRFTDMEQPLTVMGLSPGGECSIDPVHRTPILFTHNLLTGCFFKSQTRNCSDLRSQLYSVLQGLASPDLVAMSSGSQPAWSRVLVQECPLNWQENCETGCVLPVSLFVHVLWAGLGWLSHPQSYVLGARYSYECLHLQCPLSSALSLTTEVRFVDTSVYPQSPRGEAQPNWRFPFGFFSGGWDELDGHMASRTSRTRMQNHWLLPILLMALFVFYWES